MRVRSLALVVFAVGLWSACPPAGDCSVDQDCKTGSACCGGKCLDVSNDKSNCGACGVQCALPNAVPTCRSGRCQLQCETGFGNCNGSKDDGCEEELASSSVACGRCGNVCTLTNAMPACVSSECTVASCGAGFANCDGTHDNGCEVNTRSDVLHCGGCATPCLIANGTPACDAGTCQVGGCDAGAADCDANPATGCETVLASDHEHCGACGAACDARRTCLEGGCWARQLIVYGGVPDFSGAPPSGEVFRFDLEADAGVFTKLNPVAPSGAPPPRSHHAVAWDRRRDRMLVWGGIDGAGVAVAADLWALDFSVEPPAWRKVVTAGPAPRPRASPAFAVDDAAGQLYVFGGTDDAGGGHSDLSRFDFGTDTWVALHGDDAAGAPTSRIHAVGAFEPGLRRFVVFGGTNPVTRIDSGELWEFDVAQGAWRTPPRSGGAVARGLGALFGGPPLHLFSGVAGLLSAPATVTEFAQLDLAQPGPWQQLPAGGPAERFNAATAQQLSGLCLFGGAAVGSTGPTLTPDLWRYDVSSQAWTRLSDGTGPAPTGKFAARMVAR